MYLLICIILALAFIIIFLFHKKKKNIIRKICTMQIRDRETLLNNIVNPLGYIYIPEQDIFSTTINAWQRNFGYSELYTNYSHHFNLIFDSEPIYFNYDNKTWLIQFWKGQYGMNLGCEVGIYYTDTIISPDKYKYTIFKSVNNTDMLLITIKLLYKGILIGKVSKKHWWLTIFDLGAYAKPSQLTMDITIAFKDNSMRDAFINALSKKGYSSNSICISNKYVHLFYKDCSSCLVKGWRKTRYIIAMFINNNLCKSYNLLTRPFYTSLDKALFLYFYLPFIFRILFRCFSNIKKNPK